MSLRFYVLYYTINAQKIFGNIEAVTQKLSK
jgi:hypothetical protein